MLARPDAALAGACCAFDGCGDAGNILECTVIGGIYKGDASSCDEGPGVCSAPVGGCCGSVLGHCVIGTRTGCENADGSYLGDSTSCSPDLCGPAPTRGTFGDFKDPDDRSGRNPADLLVWRPASGEWRWLTARSGFVNLQTVRFGLRSLADTPLIGDMDGDGKSDPVVYRPGPARFYWMKSSSDYSSLDLGTARWGYCPSGDTPLLGDMDGDGMDDPVIFRTETGAGATVANWYWLQSSKGLDPADFGATRFGNILTGDRPLLLDIDGDGKADPTIWRQCNGYWMWKKSSTGYTQFGLQQWGDGDLGDFPILADMDGDRRGDLVIYRPTDMTWYIYYTATGAMRTIGFAGAMAGDIPLVRDLDGDGWGDVILWRPSTATFTWRTSSSDYATEVSRAHGAATDWIPSNRETENASGMWLPFCGTGPFCL